LRGVKQFTDASHKPAIAYVPLVQPLSGV
jgi:hypothetical protein